MATPAEFVIHCPLCSWMDVETWQDDVERRLDSHIESKHTDEYDAWALKKRMRKRTRLVVLERDEHGGFHLRGLAVHIITLRMILEGKTKCNIESE